MIVGIYNLCECIYNFESVLINKSLEGSNTYVFNFQQQVLELLNNWYQSLD
jgi:hypothetical protein